MINVLHVIGYLGRGGDTTVVMEVMKYMDKNKYHFDFITHEGTTDMELVKKLRGMGCTVYILKGDVRKLGPVKYYKEIKNILKNSDVKYDAVHTHTSMQSGIALAAAKHSGIKIRVCHSHVTTIQRKASMVKKIISIPVFKFLYNRYSTKKVACSKMAGDFLFGNIDNYTLIYNAVDLQKFIAVTEDDVKNARRELGINRDDIVIGHIARMSEMKNQQFDIQLAKLTERDKNIKFVLVGDGKDFQKIKDEAQSVSDKVILTGQRNDVPVLMKGFDCVILPSLSGEGFPVTVMEAQAAGCRCIISDTVTPEVEVGLNLVEIISLDNTEAWVNAVRNITRNNNMDFRNKCAEELRDKGFDKGTFVDKWLSLYAVNS